MRQGKRLWSTQQTAAFLGLPTSTLYQLNSKGTGPRYFTVGRYCRYDPDDVTAWLNARASTPTAQVPA